MFRAPTLLRSHAVPRHAPRPFSTTTPSLSALFNLNGLAHSRESQYLSKERGIPRTEYSSNIHLIRSSEVDPFPNAPGASKHANESHRLSRKRAGRESTTAAVAPTEESLVRYLLDNTHPTQQRKNIQELVAQLRAAREEIAHLRATTLQRSLGNNEGHHVPRHSGWQIPSLLTLACGFGGYLWVTADHKSPLVKDEAKERIAVTSAADTSQTELAEETSLLITEPVTPAVTEFHDPPRNQKRRSPFSFLWASA